MHLFMHQKLLLRVRVVLIITNSKKISLKLKVLRNHGQKGKPYFYAMTGGNFRLSNLLASISYSQLLRVREIIKKTNIKLYL